jgi:hypothetical protein
MVLLALYIFERNRIVVEVLGEAQLAIVVADKVTVPGSWGTAWRGSLQSPISKVGPTPVHSSGHAH